MVVVRISMSMNVEAEIRDLKRRVGELEGSFGFLTQQVKSVHRDLLAFQERTEQRFDKIDARFETVDARFEKVDGRFDRLEKEARDFRKNLPEMISSTMRDVLAERDKRREKP